MTDNVGDSRGWSTTPNPNFPQAGYLDPALDRESRLELPPTVEPGRRRVFRTGRVIGVAVAAVLALAAGAGVYAFQTLASSGIQPEQVLPSTVVAFAKVDFDPAASQKIAVYRLAQRLPGLKAELTDSDHISDAIVGAGVKAGTKSWSYQTDVKPWLGSRVAVGEVLDEGSDEGLDPVVAIAYTNRTKMVAALAKARSQGVKLGYVTTRGYVLISDSQAHANLLGAQAAKSTLNANRTFSSDVARLGGHQVAEGWADYGGVIKAVSKSRKGKESASALAATPGGSGRFVAGVHASATYLELSGYEIGKQNSSPSASADTIAHLPADTTGALELAGLGPSLTRTWAALPADAKQEYLSLANQFDVNLPADFDALLGSDLTVAVRGADQPGVAVSVKTSEATRAKTIIESLVGKAGISTSPIEVTSTAAGYVAGDDAAFNAQVSAANGQLGSSPAFREALPNVAAASMIGYFDVAAALNADSTLTPKQRHDWGHLSAVGVTVNPSASGSSFTVRMTTH